MRYQRLSTSIIVLLAATASVHAADELVLGYSMAKTGPYVSLANTNEIAVDMAVEEINRNGGVNGRRLKVIKFDTGGDPKQATLAVRRFAEDDKALAVIGPFSSSEVKVAFPAGERLRIVQIRWRPPLVASLKDKRLPTAVGAIAYATDDTVSKSIGTGVLPKLFDKYAVPVKGAVDFQYNAFDLSPQVSQLAALKADVIGLGAPPEAAINIAKEMKRQGVQARIIGGTTIADPELPHRMDAAGETMTIGTTFFKDVNERTRAFTAEFAKRARAAKLPRIEPNQMDAAVYDIVYLYAEAMKLAGLSGDPARLAAERTALRDRLAGLKDYAALEGKLSFDTDRDAIKPIYIIEVKGGKWTLLDTREPK
jgi:branched-chain amino acid transport system substrate-binding protein